MNKRVKIFFIVLSFVAGTITGVAVGMKLYKPSDFKSVNEIYIDETLENSQISPYVSIKRYTKEK